MATASATVSSNAVSSNCGSWSSLQWQASGCAINTYGQDQISFTHSIPLGSVITGISGAVNAYTSGSGSTTPGYLEIAADGDLASAGVMRASTAISLIATDYSFSASGLSVPVSGTSLTNALRCTFLNKENFYTSNHNIGVIDLTITYDPPASSSNLFFGSTF